MKVATRRLLEGQIAVVVVLESGKNDDASCATLLYSVYSGIFSKFCNSLGKNQFLFFNITLNGLGAFIIFLAGSVSVLSWTPGGGSIVNLCRMAEANK